MAGLQTQQGVFRECCNKVFESWTLLGLAVDHGWGGRQSRRKAEALVEEVAGFYLSGRKVDTDKLVEWLEEELSSQFRTMVDDDSAREVVMLLERLFESVSRGDASVAHEIMRYHSQAASSRELSKEHVSASSAMHDSDMGHERYGAGDDSDNSEDSSDDSDSEAAERKLLMDVLEAPDETRQASDAPMVSQNCHATADGEGWTTVTRRVRGSHQGERR